MKQFFVTIFLLIIALLQINAQTYGWKKIATLNGAGRIFFIDSVHGWASGGSDAIYRTTDGGATWASYPGVNAFGIYSISFADTLYGWCVGSDGAYGRIIHTTNGGKTWEFQLEKFRRFYLNVFAASILKNITAGQTKNQITPDTGKIIQTTDSGKSWTETTPFDSSVVYNKIQFLDSLNGFIWGKPPLRTRDGGKTWQALPQDDRIESPSFIDTLRGWGGYSYGMFHTIDGGMSWKFQSFLDQPDQLSINDVDFTDSLNGWAFGFQFYQGVVLDAIYRTIDGGNNWYREEVGLSQSGSTAEISHAQMLNKNLGWAVCSNGSVLKYQIITSVVEKLSEQRPKTFILRQNYPNPFNPITTIEYELQKHQTVTLFITDALGKRIETILNNTFQEAGAYRVKFDGRLMASGIYFYTILTETFSDTKQMILIK